MSVHSIISRSLALALLLAMVACVKNPSFSDGPDRVSVPVKLSLAIAPEEAATKTDYEPDAVGYDTDAAVKTLLILQFEWQDAVNRDAAVLISQRYVQYGDPISLVASSARNTVFVVANAWGKAQVAIGTSLGEFLAKGNCNLLNALDDMTGNGIWYSPNGGADRYLRMSASLELPDGVPLDDGLGSPETIGPFYLKRNCAKVVVHVKNSSAAPDKINIDKVQLCDVNRKYYYVTGCTGFADIYSPSVPFRYNEEDQDFPETYNTSGATQTYTYYVPINLRGSIANTSQIDKNCHALQGATRFCIYATYGTPERNITYTYYLGANLTSDFNLQPNKKYEYTIDINGKGDPATDSRIEDVDEVKFTVDANCYMLNPPSRTGASTTFFIPVRRAAVFWNVPGTNMGVYGAATTDYYELLENTTWEAFLVWNDVEDKEGCAVADSELLAGSYENGDGVYVLPGQGFDPDNTGTTPFIKIKVTEGMKGNALVAIRKTSGASMDDILWSWHLWVTDYDPYYQIMPIVDDTLTPESEAEYVYTVPDGEIHRYGGATWASADYSNAFMMDRNIGALISVPTNASEQRSSIGLYYQRGRKDPFPNTGTVPSTTSDMAGTSPEGSGPKYNIRYSIHNPQTFIKVGANVLWYWTYYEETGTIIGVDDGVWLDPKADQHGSDNCEAGKSVYDPCPPGWRIPVKDAWSDITNTTKEVLPSRIGGYYYPEGSSANAPKGRIFYPFTGWRRFNTAAVEAINTFCYLQSQGMTSPFIFHTYNAGYNIEPQRISAIPVRCIRLDYTRPF